MASEGDSDGEGFRYQAPIAVEQAGAFVRLPLPVSVYAHSRRPGLADLRIVDARGERVPFALLAPRANEAQAGEATRAAALYPLPPRRPGEAEPASPLEVRVVGDRITVRRLAPPASPSVSPSPSPRPAGTTRSPMQQAQAGQAGPAPGWLFDLGERTRDEAPPTSLRLAWSGPVVFGAAFDLAVSDDLRQWRGAGGGQLLALDSAAGRLTQPNVMLPTSGVPRFVRLRWLDAANAPVLISALQVRSLRSSVVLDAPTALVVQPLAGAADAAEKTAKETAKERAKPSSDAPQDAPGALRYDLGAVLPVLEIDLELPATHRVAPVRVQGRAREEEPWRDLAQTVFYRIERSGHVDRPPPLVLRASVRHLRLVPDVRSGPLPATPLAVQAQLSSIVFAAQGQAPYRLLAGSTDAAPGVLPGALPISTLVPALDEERPRLGRASLGAWSENEAVARAEAWRQRLVAWRPALLWAVLLVGVAALGTMVWRLARASGARAG
ncbi:MAG: DUF3999 family protein [Burkholderiales bacterium]|nr:DUF3999 family protein [Burkholderiales bacterium]